MSTEARPELRAALNDFRWLLERHYPERPSVALVGDRYRLSKSERAILYRGVCSTARADRRRRRLISLAAPVSAAGEAFGDASRNSHRLVVDGYNVLFTVIHYIQGKKLFRALDGFVRDTGSGSGRISRWDLFEEAGIRLVELLASVHAPAVEVYLDHRMTRSRDHIGALREIARGRALGAEWNLVEQADRVIRERAAGDAALATADSELIDKSDVPLLDAGGEIVCKHYGGTVLELAELLEEYPRPYSA